MSTKGPSLSQEPAMEQRQKPMDRMEMHQITISNMERGSLFIPERGRYEKTEEDRLDGGKIRCRPGAE